MKRVGSAVTKMGYLKNEPLPDALPAWTPFRDITDEVPQCPMFSVGKTYVNSRYMVSVERTPQKDGTVQIYLSIKDLWRSARHDWRDFQKIKNELVGQEQMMIEIYPPESRLLDTANQFHLWGVQAEDGSPMSLPIGFDYRFVTEETGHGEVQRHFDPHVRPKDLEQQMALASRLNAMYEVRSLVKAGRLKVGRNEACPCGSETKFKKCCGRVS